MRKIKLIASIDHDGKTRNIGDVIDVADNTAQYLINIGFAIATIDGQQDNDDVGGRGEEEEITQSESENAEADDINPVESSCRHCDIADMTRDKLAQELSLLGVPFRSNASRNTLIDLLRNALPKGS